ncbi:unnamed protein product [Ambrosiozyma monospora]|uniref:Unnamed protein product n=1 Tax=Ambrosiozyma monospora TaxID=43982 RepID=A0ACB5SZQ7_AMBMO|nr:unnamed protein product [Ambrosiozyma monospora]
MLSIQSIPNLKIKSFKSSTGSITHGNYVDTLTNCLKSNIIIGKWKISEFFEVYSWTRSTVYPQAKKQRPSHHVFFNINPHVFKEFNCISTTSESPALSAEPPISNTMMAKHVTVTNCLKSNILKMENFNRILRPKFNSRPTGQISHDLNFHRPKNNRGLNR